MSVPTVAAPNPPRCGLAADWVTSTMVIDYDPPGVAILRLTAMSDGCRHDLRKAVHKLLPECPAAIIVDLSEVSHVTRLVQMTLLALAVEAMQEPATPLGFCATDPEVIHDLTRNGRTMRVFANVDEARRALMAPTHSPSWIQRRLGSGSAMPSTAAGHVDDACSRWGLAPIQESARHVAFHLVWMARGPYELHLTLSLRSQRKLLINVRNYSSAAKSSPDRSIRMGLTPVDEARILAKGATGCGRLVTGAGVAWWAMLNGHISA